MFTYEAIHDKKFFESLGFDKQISVWRARLDAEGVITIPLKMKPLVKIFKTNNEKINGQEKILYHVWYEGYDYKTTSHYEANKLMRKLLKDRKERITLDNAS